ncbi:MAG: ribosome-associated translation inhibitor RaiA [Elusimicrobiales bacterium]|nr:ribosome-associated translation inhibitor RaiA [Elusimicrobiales bacterium]
MTVQIVARHVKLTKSLKDYIQERLDRVQHYFDHIIWAQVILTMEKKVSRAEIIIHAARQTFKAGSETSDMYSSMDAATDKIETQIKKYKERLKDHHPEETALLKAAEAALPQADIKFSVVKQVSVLPMSADDAAFEMERLGYNFWLFQDEETKQLNVVFKRLDSTYGLLQPVKR